jgi:hypothetical protein
MSRASHARSRAAAVRGQAPDPDPRPRALGTIVLGGLAIGVLDGLAAVAVSWLRGGVPPLRVFQYIASGVLGAAAFAGGRATGGLGVLLHFVIAFGVAAVYHVAGRRFPALLRHSMAGGAVYGLIAFFTMRQLVIPLSAASRPAVSLSGLLTGMLVHILFVGLPVALVARWSAAASHRTGRQ